MVNRIAAVSALVGLVSGVLRAQTGTIVGSVTGADDGQPLQYASVAIVGDREILTSSDGRFSLAKIEPGVRAFRIRRIGFVALDTTVLVKANETVRLDAALVRLGVRLTGVRVLGSRGLRLAAECPTPQASLLDLLEQVVQNAEQYRLLVREHPFWLRFSQVRLARYANGRVDSSAVRDPRLGEAKTFIQIASDKAVYQAGSVFRRVKNVDEVFVPELQDFADDAFIANHCFQHLADTALGTQRYFRVSFFPISAIATRDIAGVFLLRDNYSLAAVQMAVTGIPERFTSSFSAARVWAEFSELVPGIAVLSRLESFLEPGRKETDIVSHGEVQNLLGVVWRRGPP
jgi:hypothetical protein